MSKYTDALDAEDSAIIYCKECGQGKPRVHICHSMKVELRDSDASAMLHLYERN